jgi:hypothetical protein
MVQGRPTGGYTDGYELVCSDCGDDPDLDYRDVSLRLRRIRGPYPTAAGSYPIAAGVDAYNMHVRLYHSRQARSEPANDSNIAPERRRAGGQRTRSG